MNIEVDFKVVKLSRSGIYLLNIFVDQNIVHLKMFSTWKYSKGNVIDFQLILQSYES